MFHAHLAHLAERVGPLQRHVDLQPGLGRQGRPRQGLDVEPESVVFNVGTESGDRVPVRLVGVQKVGPAQDDGGVELARGDAELKGLKHI